VSESTPSTTAAPPPDEHQRIEAEAEAAPGSRASRFMASSAGRNMGLVVALALLCAIGVITAGDLFVDIDNVITILRLSVVLGIVSVGMTFVIIGGGIDLSVGSVVALASVWATTVATQDLAADFHWIIILTTAMLVGAGCGLVNGVLVAYGRIAPFIATLAMFASARGLAEVISDKRNQLVDDDGYIDFFTRDLLGVPVMVYVFALVAAIGWVLLNRTTFGRRTIAIGGNEEAARLAGIKVQRHTTYLYVLVGATAGISAAMLLARTGTGTAQHGLLLELDAIAAVVIGGTLLTGGRGTIVGTVIGVLIFTTLTNIFTLNDVDTSNQTLAKGVIIVAAVLLQQAVAKRAGST
jgi:ribose transport system permease protein